MRTQEKEERLKERVLRKSGRTKQERGWWIGIWNKDLCRSMPVSKHLRREFGGRWLFGMPSNLLWGGKVGSKGAVEVFPACWLKRSLVITSSSLPCGPMVAGGISLALGDKKTGEISMKSVTPMKEGGWDRWKGNVETGNFWWSRRNGGSQDPQGPQEVECGSDSM